VGNWWLVSETSAILEAANFAAEKHSGQRRKGAAREPYINHLLEVAHLVSTAISQPDPNLVIAALLHDSIEDAGVTREDIVKRFGPDVADLVAEVTDDKSLPKAERKRLQIVNAPKKSIRAQVIKLADKISNLRSMLVSPPADWDEQRKREYFEWAKAVVGALPNPNPILKAEFERIIREYEMALAGRHTLGASKL
jgi:(p)ppGpp synthase/HD superfamily hydrolase